MRKSQPILLLEHNPNRLGMEADLGSDSYSSNSSFTDSYSNDGSDLANWEEYVAGDGSLFYAEYWPHSKRVVSGATQGQTAERHIEFTRSSSLRLGKKQTRRQQTAASAAKLHKQTLNIKHGNGNHNHQQQLNKKQESVEFRFSHIKSLSTSSSHDGNCKQLELVITAADRFRFGRRSTAVESILGFRVVPFVDAPECLMLDSFVHDMPTMQQQNGDDIGQSQAVIKRGDWFKSLDDIDIHASNVDDLLLQFVEPTKVCLKFVSSIRDGPEQESASAAGYGHTGAGPDSTQQLRIIENFAMFADTFQELILQPLSTSSPAASTSTKIFINDQAEISPVKMPFALLVLPPECYQHDQHKDSLYYYPECAQTNFLYKARGSFLTLNAVLSEELQTRPLTSRLLVEQVSYFVNYRWLNGFLVIFAYATNLATMAECALRSDELIEYIRFAFPTLNLDSFASSSETSAGVRLFLRHFSEIQRVRLLAASRNWSSCQFEELLKESRSMPLPKEAQLRIFDALSEMEAMDYRNWNDEPLTTHREFFIYGSLLYYDCFMIASQLPVEIRSYVEGFLRCRGIFDFISRHTVRELYVWEEVALPNATGRYFLTVCTRSHLILAVILKIFDAPDMTPNMVIPPSLFYIEEIQETLDHLIQCGIESLALFWSISNKRPEVLNKADDVSTGEVEIGKESKKLETFLKQKLTVTGSSGATGPSSSAYRGNINDEDNQLCSSLGGSSIQSLTPSEDDFSRKRLNASNAGEDSDSGSDWDNFSEQHPLHYTFNAERQYQMSESLWKEINSVVPVKISAGWKNSIFYYVYVDSANGSIFCPLKTNFDSFPFLSEMRKACHVIHEVLQSTKNIRRQLAETTKSNGGGSITALVVKEHGITLGVQSTAKQQSEDEDETKVRFVVVGRLFNSPTKEVYVCHRPEVPQNMVELAFRLSFFSVG